MRLSNLKDVVKEKCKPLYLLEKQDTFKLSKTGDMGHLCVYTKLTANLILCEHETMTAPRNILVYPCED